MSGSKNNSKAYKFDEDLSNNKSSPLQSDSLERDDSSSIEKESDL